MEKGEGGQTYNVGSGHSLEIGKVLESILSMAMVPIQVEVDTARFRPVDVPEICADISKLQQITGWQAQIPLETTLADILAYWRQRGVEELQ
jgi:GDP-4-dehydro-6-deoxy-D-mannose reductase